MRNLGATAVAGAAFVAPPPKYRPYTINDLGKIPQVARLPGELRRDMEVVAQVLPFRANNFIVEELIDWSRVPDDPYFRLVFPVREMLLPGHFETMSAALASRDRARIQATANAIRQELNPHPAGQLESNRPCLEGNPLDGMQHKYGETVLFFPSQGQTCHAYCSFCFRWPQFVGEGAWRIASRETDTLIEYIRATPQVTDVLFTGGDPLIMKTRMLAAYIDRLLEADLPNLTSIRLGTKALSFWPHRFLSDPDADELLALFERVVRAGKHLAFMAHFNHGRALTHPKVQAAIARIRNTGAEIRTQSPLLAHINDDPQVWSEMWQEQVKQGCIPYYMFLARDTGAQHYFGVPLARAWDIFQNAYQQVSGLARTVRGPSMSAAPGKVQVMGVNEIEGKRVFTLQFLQGRDPDWVLKPFFAEYDPEALWLDDLRPAFGAERFFFEEGGV